MTSAPFPATPDLMMLMCLIGRAMRWVGPSPLGMRLLLIGVVCPAFGEVIRTWLDVEEHMARAPDSDDPWWGLEGDDGDGAVRSGWIDRTGPVWRWRHVTSFGSVLVVLVRWFAEQADPARLRRGAVWVPGWVVSCRVWRVVFLDGLVAMGEV